MIKDIVNSQRKYVFKASFLKTHPLGCLLHSFIQAKETLLGCPFRDEKMSSQDKHFFPILRMVRSNERSQEACSNQLYYC